ncbi:MAG: DUF4912 domain-containing protein [Firmicutes bacterium]|nr:DUF4912 domain-containing protein [Bacillota bacterium]
MDIADRHQLNAGWTLPAAYGIDRLVLLPRDPHKLFAYWEITSRLTENLRSQYGDLWDQGKNILQIIQVETNLKKEIEINAEADCWYIDGMEADRIYQAKIGRRLPDGRFICFVASNMVRTPRNSLSPVIDPRWRIFAFWQHYYYHRKPGGYSSAEFCPQKRKTATEGGS